MTQREIPATPAAKAALSQVRASHGDIILHVTGGWCARTPLVLKRDEIKLGVRDVLIGTVDGVPVYRMQTAPDEAIPSYVLDVVDGLPIGFSIEPAPGKHFVLNGSD